jgi:hypothetical protein
LSSSPDSSRRSWESGTLTSETTNGEGADGGEGERTDRAKK